MYVCMCVCSFVCVSISVCVWVCVRLPLSLSPLSLPLSCARARACVYVSKSIVPLTNKTYNKYQVQLFFVYLFNDVRWHHLSNNVPGLSQVWPESRLKNDIRVIFVFNPMTPRLVVPHSIDTAMVLGLYNN